MPIDPVILRLKAEVADYQRDVTRAATLSEEKLARIDRAGHNTGVALRKGFDFAKGAAIAFAASLGVESIVGAIKTGLDYASSLKEVSQQLGVTTDALQEYRYAGSQSGLSTQETDTALRQLTKSLGEAAAGTKAQAQAFDTLKISIRDTSGNVIDAGRALPLIAEALKGIESPAERSRLMIDLFGESAQKLEPLLAGGAGAIDELRDAAHRLGIVLSEDQIQRADETADKLAAIKQVLEARIAGVVADNANAILVLADAFARLASSVAGAIGMYEQFKLKQGLGENRLNELVYGLSPLPSDQRKAAGFRNQAKRFEGALANRNAKAVQPGEVRTLSGKRYTYDYVPPNGPDLAPFTPAYKPKPKAKRDAASPRVATGPSAADIEQRFRDELAGYAQQALSAMQSLALNAEERAEYELRSVELARIRTLEEIEADKDYSKAQKARLAQQVEALAELEREAVERQRVAQVERETQELVDEINRAEQDALRLQYDLADTQADRRDIALQILEAEDRYLKSKLEALIASETTTEAEKERARIALAAIDAQAGAKREQVDRQFEGPLARYARDAKDANERVQEAAARRIADLNDTIADTMTKALGVKDPFLRDLLKIFLDQNVFGPLAEALSGQSGSGNVLGGIIAGIGSIFGIGGGIGGGLPGRANGGPLIPGQATLVGERGPEVILPNVSSTVIPNHMLGRGQAGGVVRIIVEEGPNFMSTIRAEATGVAIEVTKSTAPQVIDAAAGETVRRLSRPRM